MYLPRLLFVSLSSSTSRILGLRRAIYGRFLPSRQAFVSAGQHAVSNLSQISVSVSSLIHFSIKETHIGGIKVRRFLSGRRIRVRSVSPVTFVRLFGLLYPELSFVPHDDVILIALSVSNLEPNHDPITDDLLL